MRGAHRGGDEVEMSAGDFSRLGRVLAPPGVDTAKAMGEHLTLVLNEWLRHFPSGVTFVERDGIILRNEDSTLRWYAMIRAPWLPEVEECAVVPLYTMEELRKMAAAHR